jgi:hypothetical protein
MKAMGKFARPTVLFFSVALAGSYIWYNSSQASRQTELPESVAESESERNSTEAIVVVPASATQKDTLSPSTVIFPGSKSLVLPGSKSMPLINLDTPKTILIPTPPADQKPATSPPMGDQKPAQSPPPTPEGKK